MPRDSGGIYSLPVGYLATTGETVQPSQHNPPMEDIAAALSGSLPRNGAAAMTGPIKGYAGTAIAPGYAFDGDTNSGFFSKSADEIGVAVGGVEVGSFSSTGLSNGVPVGAGMDFWGATAPALWLFAYGQAVSRTTYAALFAAIGTAHGAGDGSTTFNLPDKRGRASFGKDNMGGTSANRITDQTDGFDGDVLGDVGGAETNTLTVAQMPSHNHGGATGNPTTLPAIANAGKYSGSDTDGFGAGDHLVTNDPVNIPNHVHSISSQGGGTAHNNLPPGIVCNYIIFAGV